MMLEFVLILVSEAERLSMIYIVENPQNSWMWAQPAWKSLHKDYLTRDFLTEYCVYGTRWKKATRFRTNGQLGNQRLRCSRDHVHQVLRGRGRTSGINFTKLAEPYPRRLCELLGQALVQDAKWVEECRPLDLIRCAKCSGARFGEASHPGPRPRRRRPAAALSEVQLVEPVTAALSVTIWSRFMYWLATEDDPQLGETVLSFPELLV